MKQAGGDKGKEREKDRERERELGRAGETGTVYTNERVGSAAECRLLITAGSEVQQQQWQRQQQKQQREQRAQQQNTNNKAQKTMNAEQSPRFGSGNEWGGVKNVFFSVLLLCDKAKIL